MMSFVGFVSKCIYYWPEDGRVYVALGKILSKQSKMVEARAVYEKGCQATQGENPYIWQVISFCYSLCYCNMIALIMCNAFSFSWTWSIVMT
jgi:hypothetical protein